MHMAARVRRIITGSDATGADTFVETAEVAPVTTHVSWHGIVGWDSWPTLPIAADAQFVPGSSFPGPDVRQGVRVVIVDFPPGLIVDRNRAGSKAGNTERFTDYARDGMHSTDSVDVIFVMYGEVTLTLGNGDSRRLTAGDCVVQNGTRHRWTNEGSEPCRLGFVVFSADRS
jgi:mannose-6-phosphate isomerase-like protein (cupin superfamily)